MQNPWYFEVGQDVWLGGAAGEHHISYELTEGWQDWPRRADRDWLDIGMNVITSVCP